MSRLSDFIVRLIFGIPVYLVLQLLTGPVGTLGSFCMGFVAMMISTIYVKSLGIKP